MAATSHESVSATAPGMNITAEASATSVSQLIAGIAIAGGGGYPSKNS